MVVVNVLRALIIFLNFIYYDCKNNYTLSKANLDLGKNMLLLENPQFLSNHNETLPK